jgi:hypothetical protein
MATKLWHVPVRLATGAIPRLGADEETARWLHGQAVFGSSGRRRSRRTTA